MLTYGETYSILNELSFSIAALAQLVERRLGKETLSSSILCFHAVLAQSVARRLGKAEVGGSSPLDSFEKYLE